MENVIEHYDSLTEFLDAAPKPGSSLADEREMYWPELGTYKDAFEKTLTGDARNVRKAEALLDRIEASGILGDVRPAWVRDVAGDFPCVPSYLAGDPMAMHRRAMVASESATGPINIYVDAISEWSIGENALRERGVAVLALVLALQRTRPVDLWLICGMDGFGAKSGKRQLVTPCIRLETRPLDLQTLSYIIPSAAFARLLCYAWGRDENRGFSGRFAFGQPPTHGLYRSGMRAALECNERDLIVYGSDVDVISKDPIKWISEQIEYHNGERELAA